MPTWKELKMDSRGRSLGLSADGSGMLTTSGFIPFQTRDHSPLSEQHTEQWKTSAQTQLSVAYWISDGWIWRVDRDVGPRRVCWLPPLYREIGREKERLQHGYTATGQPVICMETNGGGFVLLDLSRCFSESCKFEYVEQHTHASEAYEYPTASP